MLIIRLVISPLFDGNRSKKEIEEEEEEKPQQQENDLEKLEMVYYCLHLVEKCLLLYKIDNNSKNNKNNSNNNQKNNNNENDKDLHVSFSSIDNQKKEVLFCLLVNIITCGNRKRNRIDNRIDRRDDKIDRRDRRDRIEIDR